MSELRTRSAPDNELSPRSRSPLDGVDAVGARAVFTRRVLGALLGLMVLLLVVAAAHRLSSQGPRLLIASAENRNDLDRRHDEVERWFSGSEVYLSRRESYPPASYALLWPLVGWLSPAAARWLLALSGAFALGWLVRQLAEGSRSQGVGQIAAVALVPLASVALASTLHNGQLALHVLPPTIAAILLLHRRPASWPRDLAAAGLLLLALVKPSSTAPFFWLLAALGGLRPAALVATGYGGLTLLAAAFQADGLFALLRRWAAIGAMPRGDSGYGTLQVLLAWTGFERWTAEISLFALLALGVWIAARRRSDPWILLGVTAIFARTWTYHRDYDDLLLLLPAAALLRIARSESPPSAARARASAALAAILFGLLAPATFFAEGHYLAPCFRIGVPLAWLAAGAVLVGQAHSRSGGAYRTDPEDEIVRRA